MVHLVRRAVMIACAVSFSTLACLAQTGLQGDALKTRAIEASKTVLEFNRVRGADLYPASLVKQGKVHVQSDSAFTTVRVSEASVRVFNKDGRLASYHSQEPQVNGIGYTQVQCERSARDFARAVGLTADTMILDPTQDENTVRFNIIASYGRFTSTQLITVEVSRATSAVRSAYFSPWMDHLKLAGSKLKSTEECLSAAGEAYARYAPFPQGKIVDTKLMLGMPNYGPQIANELQPEHLTLIQQRIAMPILRVTVADQSVSNGMSRQIIDVDARTGRALSILPMSPMGKSGKVTRHAMPEATFKLMGSTVAGALHPTGDQGEPQTKGIPVTLRSGNSLVTLIRPSGSEKLWFFDGMGWQAYRADPKLTAALKGYKKPAKFGKAKA